MIVNIKKGTAQGKVSAPPSKSMAHRLIICASLSEGESKDKPKVTITYNGMDLEEGKDYTVEYSVSPDGEEGIVTVSGMGNYSGMLSERFEIKNFDHATWLIPVITAILLGGAALALILIKKKKR